ncbi:SpoIVB peptidase S55 domain-containing protein [Nibricoccus aquaticus]|nr:SpoIVB peptidase S55 domain-containing protein [Nibricoccus aquaticus]
MPKFAALALAFLVALAAPLTAQPTDAPQLPLAEIKPGQTGEVWTVFQGTQIEPFSVVVTGVLQNALGPGKSLIVCELTDPRVQKMGAVAGMSGSPLYIDGKLAGALSYQIQRFETVRFAGFTPIGDLIEVSQFETKSPRPVTPHDNNLIPLDKNSASTKRTSSLRTPLPSLNSQPSTLNFSSSVSSVASDSFTPLTPVFALGGISPQVAALFTEDFRALGLNTTALGGHTNTSSANSSAASASHPSPFPLHSSLRPGSAVAVALATGDITLAGTGTVSHVNGNHILAFGHPMLGLGDVELPMASAEILTILPSALNSFKLSNTGEVIGTISQDRLSAIYGEIGPKPAMLPVVVKTPARTLNFSTVRHDRLAPMIAGAGLSQAVLGSNENGLAEGFHITTTITYPGGRTLATDTIFAGPQGFQSGLSQFIRRLSASLGNPIADVFPDALSFVVETLPKNPAANLDLIQVSRTRLQPGDDLQVTLTVRDYQGSPVRETVSIPVPSAWLGRRLELLVMRGDALERVTGRPEMATVSQIRSFDSYLDLMSDKRRDDGLYVVVAERAGAFLDQTQLTLDYPGSIERIARGSDETRFQKRDVLVPLWETHLFPGKLLDAAHRRPLQVSE